MILPPLFRGLLVAGLLSTVAGAASGADTGTDTYALVIDNDLFYNADSHYTNGVRLIRVPGARSPTPSWQEQLARRLPWFPADGVVRRGYAVGQSMFTAADIRERMPPADQRPYAGWLYASLGLDVDSGRRIDQFGITLGTVGPSSLADKTQIFVHRVVGSPHPRGWDTQLHDEPGLALSGQRSWRGMITTTFSSGAQLDLTPHVGVVLGNALTQVSNGATLRYGRELPRDHGPPRIQAGLPGAGDFAPRSGTGWYLFATVEAREVLLNIFLDGNSDGEGRSVDKLPLVADLQYGAVFDWRSLRVSYSHVFRSPEYRDQGRSDTFGALSVAMKF